MPIGLSGLFRKQGLPLMLNVVEHIGDELRRPVLSSGGSCGPAVRGGDMASTGEITSNVVSARNQADDDQKDEADNSNTAAAEAAAGRTTSVLDVAAEPSRSPIHRSPR